LPKDETVAEALTEMATEETDSEAVEELLLVHSNATIVAREATLRAIVAVVVVAIAAGIVAVDAIDHAIVPETAQGIDVLAETDPQVDAVPGTEEMIEIEEIVIDLAIETLEGDIREVAPEPSKQL
jgi:hypothetical protein